MAGDDEVERGREGRGFAETGPLVVSLMGGFSVRLGDREVPAAAFARRRARSLIKLLALAPRHQLHRDRVLDILWPDLDATGAAAQLYKAVHQVRAAFKTVQPTLSGSDVVQLRDELLKLVAPGGVETDVEAFETAARGAIPGADLRRLEQAVACYPGELLPADRYEEWALRRRDELAELVVELRVRLGQAHLSAGSRSEAAASFRAALAEDPAREQAHLGLMSVHAAQGSHTRVVRQFRLLEAELLERLGVEPSRSTRLRYEELLERAERVDRSPPVGQAGPAVNLPALAGRRDEVQRLGGLLDRLREGTGGVLTLEGSAGVGKSRLLQEASRLARSRGFEALSGEAQPEGGRLPFQPFADTLSMALRADPQGHALLPAELGAAIPELPQQGASVGVADRLAAQQALFAAVHRFLAHRAGLRSVLLAIDDLHSADEGSIELFHHLARRASGVPMLLIVTFRSDEPQAAGSLLRSVVDLDRQGLLQRVQLRALAPPEIESLVAQVVGGEVDEDVTAFVHRLSEGNPLFASEIVRQLVDSSRLRAIDGRWRLAVAPQELGAVIPPSLDDLVAERLTGLSSGAVSLLQWAAVVGREVPLAWIEAGPGKEAGSLDRLDEAMASALLEEGGAGYRFVHTLIRDAIYVRMGEARRRAAHRQVAQVIEDLSGPGPTLAVEALAWHAREGGDEAVDHLISAGDRAERMYAHDTALGHYRRAEALVVGRPDHGSAQALATVRERMGDVLRLVGKVSASLAAYQGALAALEGAGSDARGQGAELHRKMALAAVLGANMGTAADHLAHAPGPTEVDAPTMARWLIARSLFQWHMNALKMSADTASKALATAREVGAEVEESQAFEMLSLANVALGNWEDGLRYELKRRTPDWSPEIVVAVDAHLCLLEARIHGPDPYEKAGSFIQTMAGSATNVGNLRCLAVCRYALGSMALYRGELEVAGEQLDTARVVNESIGSPAAAAYVMARQMDLLTLQGDPNRAWGFFEPALEVARRASMRDHCTMVVQTAGIRNRLAAGDLGAGAHLVAEAVAYADTAGPCTVCRTELYAALADFHLAQEHPDEAGTWAERALALGHPPNRSGEALAHRVVGEVQAARGQADDAAASLALARDLYKALGHEVGRARALVALDALSGDDGSAPDRASPR